ncbi:hypothetical protein [Streptomyces sp. NPDC058486]|uniref:hypothetical protein n=1 Tax=unclassified Streptomyces TaxID=2593676 RepID=UPI00365BD26C
MHTLRNHVDRFGLAPDGRVLRNAAGGYVDPAAYGKTWERARKKVLAPHEHPTLLAKESVQEWSRRSEDSSPRG